MGNYLMKWLLHSLLWFSISYALGAFITWDLVPWWEDAEGGAMALRAHILLCVLGGFITSIPVPKK